jgi:hypothetical protein
MYLFYKTFLQRNNNINHEKILYKSYLLDNSYFHCYLIKISEII